MEQAFGNGFAPGGNVHYFRANDQGGGANCVNSAICKPLAHLAQGPSVMTESPGPSDYPVTIVGNPIRIPGEAAGFLRPVTNGQFHLDAIGDRVGEAGATRTLMGPAADSRTTPGGGFSSLVADFIL